MECFVLIAQNDAGCLLGLQLVDDAVICIAQSRRHQADKTVAGLADNVNRCFDAVRLCVCQQARHFCAVFVIRLIQRVQQENIADVQQFGRNCIPVNMILTKQCVGAAVLEEGPLLRLVVAHNGSERGTALADDAGHVDVRMRTQLCADKITLAVAADHTDGLQRQIRVKLGKIDNDIAERAACGAADPFGNCCQLALLRPALNGIKDIDNHIAGYTYAVSLHVASSFGKVFINCLYYTQ